MIAINCYRTEIFLCPECYIDSVLITAHRDSFVLQIITHVLINCHRTEFFLCVLIVT